MIEAILIFVLLVAVGALLFFKKRIQRSLNAKAEAKGREMGLSLEDKVNNSKWANAGTLRLGTALIFPSGGRALVDDVFGQEKGVSVREENGWYLKFAKPTDVELVWDTLNADGAGVLRVKQSLDMLDGPVGDRQWMKLVKKLEKIAQHKSMPIERREGEMTKVQLSDTDAIWVTAASAP